VGIGITPFTNFKAILSYQSQEVKGGSNPPVLPHVKSCYTLAAKDMMAGRVRDPDGRQRRTGMGAA